MVIHFFEVVTNLRPYTFKAGLSGNTFVCGDSDISNCAGSNYSGNITVNKLSGLHHCQSVVMNDTLCKFGILSNDQYIPVGVPG